MSSKSAWYVKVKDGEKGPFNSRQLKKLAADGKLRPKMHVRRGEEGKWVEASRIKGLFPSEATPAVEEEVVEVTDDLIEVEPLEVIEEVAEVEPLEVELLEVEPEIVEASAVDPLTLPASDGSDDLFAGDALSLADAANATPQAQPANAFAENPYQASNSAGAIAPGRGVSGLDAKTAKKVEAIIKDAGQFWVAILLCVLCTGCGALFICPWYFVRLSQWKAIAKSHPQLLAPSSLGSMEHSFQSAKSKLTNGIVAGAVLLLVASVLAISKFLTMPPR